MTRTELTGSEELICKQEGPVLVVTLNRPDRMNTLTGELSRQLHGVLQAANDDPRVRAVVLTGAGRAFCAGYDLAGDVPPRSRSADTLRDKWPGAKRTPERFWEVMSLDTPVITAINGWCLGAGLWYTLASDITIASELAVFGQPEVREVADITFLLAALLGWKNAHRYGLTGDHFDAAEALRIGLVNEVVAPDVLLDRAVALGKRIAQVPVDSVRLNKAMTVRGLEIMGLRSALSTAGLLSMAIHSSTDADDLDALMEVRREKGMRESLVFRDTPFLPEPGGPRSSTRAGEAKQ